jgi:hypothetical protein
MSKKQAIGLAIIGVVVTAVLVVLHLFMPLNQSWTMNRILHYAWEAVAAGSAIGAGVWLMWPRTKARRKDEDRIRAQRKVFGMLGATVLLVGLILFAEMHREATTQRLLGEAQSDLKAIQSGLILYARDHSGARPETLAVLVPKYLDREHLFYVYRDGAMRSPPPSPDTDLTTAELSYGVVKIIPPATESAKKREQTAVSAYLHSGHAWAPLTAVIDQGDDVGVDAYVTGDDMVRGLESRRQ